jgi:hypothetical protein
MYVYRFSKQHPSGNLQPTPRPDLPEGQGVFVSQDMGFVLDIVWAMEYEYAPGWLMVIDDNGLTLLPEDELSEFSFYCPDVIPAANVKYVIRLEEGSTLMRQIVDGKGYIRFVDVCKMCGTSTHSNVTNGLGSGFRCNCGEVWWSDKAVIATAFEQLGLRPRRSRNSSSTR